MKNVLLILVFSFSVSCFAASFDCAKAGTSIEKAICSNKKLGRLDEVLAQNYKAMLASDIGDGARTDLKTSQRAWVANRNKCVDNECIAKAYKARIDEVCDYPVISGVYPPCTSADAVDDEFNQPSITTNPSAPKQTTPQQAQAAGDTNQKGAILEQVQKAAAKNAEKIASLGFSAAQLHSVIYLQYDTISAPRRFITFESFLGLLFENSRISKVTAISLQKFSGVRIKVQGAPSTGFLFNFDEGDAFLSHTVDGDDANRLTTPEDMYMASRLLESVAEAGLQ